MKQFIYCLFMQCALIFGYQEVFASEKIGVLFSSYGDVDDVSTELRPFIRTTLTDPDILPLPQWARVLVADFGWYLKKKGLKKEYEAIGGRSNMRALSWAQANGVAELLRNRGYDAAAYVGFTMTFPLVSEALGKAQAEGVQKLFVFYQGAQYSKVTMGIIFRHVREYLKSHPEWNVRVIGIRSFSDDARFLELLTRRIDRQWTTTLASYAGDEVCLFFPVHGNLRYLRNEGDPYVVQIERLAKQLRNAYPESPFFIGFQNHGEIPLLRWTQPSTERSLKKIAQNNCPAVLINGLLSFTVDNLETLYDHAVDEPEFLAQELVRNSRPLKMVVVEKMFNDDPDFVELMADLVEEADQGQGDLEVLK